MQMIFDKILDKNRLETMSVWPNQSQGWERGHSRKSLDRDAYLRVFGGYPKDNRLEIS